MVERPSAVRTRHCCKRRRGNARQTVTSPQPSATSAVARRMQLERATNRRLGRAAQDGRLQTEADSKTKSIDPRASIMGLLRGRALPRNRLPAFLAVLLVGLVAVACSKRPFTFVASGPFAYSVDVDPSFERVEVLRGLDHRPGPGWLIGSAGEPVERDARAGRHDRRRRPGRRLRRRRFVDSRPGLGWLSPLGGVEELHPRQSPRPVALAPTAKPARLGDRGDHRPPRRRRGDAECA